nr:hypothetical protein Iba_chr02eCG7510 [Ipomoea batatas]
MVIDHHVFVKNNLCELVDHQRKLLAKVEAAESHLKNNLTETLMALIKCMQDEKVLSDKMQHETHIQIVKMIQSQEARINKMEIELTQMAAGIQLLKSVSQHTNFMLQDRVKEVAVVEEALNLAFLILVSEEILEVLVQVRNRH